MRGGDLSAAPGGGDAGTQLDAARRTLSRISDYPQRIDLDRRLPDRRRWRRDRISADLPLCLSSMRRRGAEPARTRGEELAVARPQTSDDGRDQDRNR